MTDEDPTIWEQLYDTAQSLNDTDHGIAQQVEMSEKRYTVSERIGQGGMKRIFACHDAVTGREIALARPRDAASSVAAERLLREARITAQLEHPNIMPIYDMGRDEESAWFAMKRIRDRSLANYLRKPPGSDTLLVRLNVYLKICDAVAHAHEHGILHLDLKPANVQLGGQNEVLVIDWGLARFADDDAPDLHFTEGDVYDQSEADALSLDGEVQGTPGFLAPEQAQSDEQGKTRQTDVYAMGAILYNLLADRPPLAGLELNEIIDRTLAGDVPAPNTFDPTIPPSLNAVCLKAMQREPEARYASVDALRTEVTAYLQGFATKAENASVLKQLQLIYNRNRRFFITVGIAGIILFLVANNLLTRLQVSRLEATRAREVASELSQEAALERQRRISVSQTAIELLEEQIETDWVNQDWAATEESIRLALDADPTNFKGQLTAAKLLFIRQEFAKCRQRLIQIEGAPHGYGFSDLILLCKRYERLNGKVPAEELRRMVHETNPKHRKVLVSATVSAALNSYLPLSENIVLLQETLSMANHGKTIHCTYDAATQNLDLSNNPKLTSLNVIRHLPIKTLDLRNTQIESTQFLPVHTLEQLIISTKTAPEKSLKILKEKGIRIVQE